MSIESLPEWLLPAWRDLRARGERLPHALLLCGPAGSGKRLFATHFARALLCRTPDARGFACGHCADCTWLAAGNHPDLFTVIPAADEEEAEDADATEGGKKEKARSTQIVIDQVRSLQAALEIGSGGHAGGRRVVILDPAEAMNVAAANALLKSLEEPVGSTVFLLLSHVPRQLLPTIRSRCQVIDFPRPARAVAQAWLEQQGVKDAALLGFASGLPLAARELAQGARGELRRQLAAELGRLDSLDPLKLAADWEARLKSRPALECGFAMPDLLDWLQRWLADGVRVAHGLPPACFEDARADLARLAQGRAERYLEAYRAIQAHRRAAQHPLNARLFLEDIALCLRRTTA
ncbi:MAG: DNA polymerase III subunit delta' [Candidatus Dactylopiibacterium sp.]|nr:DNA polymerase III subunit delta' [Candidatus Dactylopiibacterium sp.]